MTRKAFVMLALVGTICLALSGVVHAEEVVWATDATASTQYGNTQWAARQAAGQPNTGACGDHGSAWASKTPDGQMEWLDLTFPKMVLVTEIRVVETFNPGALRKAEGFVNGAWVVLWEGLDPNAACPGTARLPVRTPMPINRIKLTFASPTVAGWNEIDAVALIGGAVGGRVIWAASATASTQYGNPQWSAMQAAGQPNTNACGDHNSAWASKTPDGQWEWLDLTFPQVVTAKAVRIKETFNPGAVRKIEGFINGGWVVIWQGQDPNSSCPGVAEIPLAAPMPLNRIRIHLDSVTVKGWNEIDAVGLVQ